MKYLVAGGSGLIGRALTDALRKAGHEVKWVSRRPKGGDVIGWSPKALDSGVGWADGVVNLAGETVAGRWNEAKKKRIFESRVGFTRQLVEAIRRAPKKPVVLVNASAVGYYGDQGDKELDESCPAGPGKEFLARVCVESEAEAAKAGPAGVRVCLIRTGLVLSPKGGFFRTAASFFKFGLGGPLGSGSQWLPWIHVQDVVEAVQMLLTKAGMRGAFNLAAPNPVRQGDFARMLGSVMGRPAVLKMPEGLVRFLLKEGAEVVLKGQRAVPKRLLEEGFTFKFPELEPALRDLLVKP